MKPLNQQERLRTFLLFSVLFLIGIAIVSIPFFSMYHLMKKENEIVRQESDATKMKMEKMQDEEKTQLDFVAQLNKIKEEINQMETGNKENIVLRSDAARHISDAKVYIVQDSINWRSSMYKSILDICTELVDTKYGFLISVDKSNNQLSEIERELRECKGDLKKCNDELGVSKSKPKINPKKAKK